MTHLGIRITSLVDGRLSLDHLDRAHAHLAGCAECRDELAAEQSTKAGLTGLGPPAPSGDLVARLLELAGPGGPVPPRPGHVPGSPRPQPLLMPGRSAFAPVRPPGRIPAQTRSATRPTGRTRVRLTAALVGTLCLVGAGVGSAAVENGGLPSMPVTPDQLVLEHAATFRTATFSGMAELDHLTRGHR